MNIIQQQKNKIEETDILQSTLSETKKLKKNIEESQSLKEDVEHHAVSLVYHYEHSDYYIDTNFIKKVIDLFHSYKSQNRKIKKIVFCGGVDFGNFPNAEEKHKEYTALYNFLSIRMSHIGFPFPKINIDHTYYLNELLATIRSMDIISHLPKDILDWIKQEDIQIKYIKEHNPSSGEKYRYIRIEIY